MAHWAEINETNQVIRVLVIADDKDENWISEKFGGTWVQTSYNTRGGEHLLGGTPLRKNFAGVGMNYDPNRDAFIAPQPFDSWVLDEETAQWQAPVEYPTDGKDYSWDEETTSWVEIAQDGE